MFYLNELENFADNPNTDWRGWRGNVNKMNLADNLLKLSFSFSHFIYLSYNNIDFFLNNLAHIYGIVYSSDHVIFSHATETGRLL